MPRTERAAPIDPSSDDAASGEGGRRPARTLVECALLAVVAFVATLYAEWPIISDDAVFQSDTLLHEYWMRRFQNPDLFRDSLTRALLETGYVPPGVRAIYWTASHIVDPVSFGEALPLVLVPASALLVFGIVGAHSVPRYAPWLGALLFIPLWDIHRFSGGHSRAFVHPIVLLVVYLAVTRRERGAMVVPAAGMLVYPPGALAAFAVYGLSALGRSGRPSIDRRRLLHVAAAGLLLAAVVVAADLLTAGSSDVIAKRDALALPEFGPDGQMHFFNPDTKEFLKENYSGFHLERSGSILFGAALVLVALGRRSVGLIRREVWAMGAGAIVMFVAAHVLLFRLYLPQRYTYPLIPFFCIVIALCWAPVYRMLTRRVRPPMLRLVPALGLPLVAVGLGLTLFPLGPEWDWAQLTEWLDRHLLVLTLGALGGIVAAAVAAARRRAGPRRGELPVSLVAASLLVAAVAAAGEGRNPSLRCPERELYAYLESLPADTVVADHPVNGMCIPVAARRAVVMSTKLYQPWDTDYLALVRARMFDLVEAYFGPSRAQVTELRHEYGADYVVVHRDVLMRRDVPDGLAPFTDLARALLRAPGRPALLRLPAGCRTFGDRVAVYDLECIAESSNSS